MPRLPLNVAVPSLQNRSMSDKEIISACLAGDQSAWDALIGRYVRLIFSVCLKMGLSETDSDDVVQDVCVILVDHLAELRDHARLSSWLISTTRREVWRFQKRRGLTLASELGEDDWALESGSPINSDSSGSPEAAMLAIEEQQLVRQGVEQLPERCRRMLTLLYATDPPATYTDIAAEFSIPVGSIGPTRARCLERLRKVLTEFGF